LWRAAEDLTDKTSLRPEQINLLHTAYFAEPNRFGIWVAEDERGEVQGLIIARRSRDDETHTIIEAAWMSRRHRADPDLLRSTKATLEKWCKANKQKTIGAVTGRDGKAMDLLMGALGLEKQNIVFYGRTV